MIPIRQYHYVYDDWNRLKEIYFNETNDKANGRKVVEYAYDDATGHITEKKHFSYEGQISKNLDTKIDLRYNYDDRLRLTQINSELFNTQLYYDASTMQFGTGNIAYSNNYNGNMNGAESYLKTSNLSNPIGAKGGYLFAGHLLYGYKYDGLNRLTLADGFDYDNVMASVSGDIDHAGDEEMTYDAIGNVLSLDRYWDPTGMATDPGKDAHYGYNYAVGNNQLLAVQNTTFTPGGASSITTQNFSYDANGNVLTDSKRNIAFTYTNGNLPESVKLQTNISGSNKSIRYHYDGSDRRISKERNDNGTLTTDFYLMDAGGSLIALVDYNTFDEKEWYINGEAKAVKRIIPAYGTQPYEIPVFYITDQHQNTRVTYSASPADISAHHFTLETATDYYAFGKVLRQYKNTGCDEKYGFQGSELEDETEDFYYTQYRHLDVDVARWWGVDPMAYHPQQLRFSPYVFSNNNPLRFTDPDGRLPLDWVKLQNGGVVFDANVNSQAQATTKYGNGAFDIGKSGVYMNGQGQQVNLNTDGTATSLTMLSEVTVTGKSGSSLIGTLDNLTDAVDLSNNLNIGAIAGASKLGNALDAATSVINVLDNVGKGLGITGAVISTAQAIENPTAGNILKAGVDISLAALKVNPLTGAAIGIVDGLLSVTGAKDAIFKALDNEVDEYQSNKEIESRQVDISKIRIR